MTNFNLWVTLQLTDKNNVYKFSRGVKNRDGTRQASSSFSLRDEGGDGGGWARGRGKRVYVYLKVGPNAQVFDANRLISRIASPLTSVSVHGLQACEPY